MIDIDKYEPTGIETLLHKLCLAFATRAHSSDGWRELSKSLIELSDDDRLLIANAPLLLAEVLRLREWENRIRTYFGDEEMMDFYDWMKEKYGEEEE